MKIKRLGMFVDKKKLIKEIPLAVKRNIFFCENGGATEEDLKKEKNTCFFELKNVKDASFEADEEDINFLIFTKSGSFSMDVLLNKEEELELLKCLLNKYIPNMH